MNVAFIVTSYWAYGELLIALNFAKSIKENGCRPYFFIPPCHRSIVNESGIPYSVLIPKNGNINRVLFSDYESRYRPDFVILADFLNYCFCERNYGLTVEDLKIFKGKLGTFDDFDWGIMDRKMDTYGFYQKTVQELDIRNFGFKLVPCPIGNPLLDDHADIGKFYYPLLNEILPYNEQNKASMRKELGLPEDKPIVLITSATWQQNYKAYPHVEKLVTSADSVFVGILKNITSDALILYVGPSGFFGGVEAPPNVIMLNQLSPKVFEKYAMASDLFISRNITSTTLSKLAVSGIPCLMLKNSIHFSSKTSDKLEYPFIPTAKVKEILESLDICYSYRMFPVGWYTFLEPVVKVNPYIDLVPEIELFNEVGCVDAINQMLSSDVAKAGVMKEASKYRGLLERLKLPSEILDSLSQSDLPDLINL